MELLGDQGSMFLLRTGTALLWVVAFICFAWFVAWKLVFVHIPLVQEMFGLKKKQPQPRPSTRRFTRIYNSGKQTESGFRVYGKDA